MEKSEILYGLSIHDRMNVPETRADAVKLMGDEYDIPLTDSVFNKHILYTGTIGTGKTTAIFQLLDQLINKMTDDDVMVIFDTKGDYKNEFFRPGKDVIVSSDDKATVNWNIFKEVLVDGKDKSEENLLELVNSLFEEKIRRSNAPFFPQAAKDVLFGIMSYIIYKVAPEDLDNSELYSYLRDAEINDVVDALMSLDDLRGIIDYIYNGGVGSEQTQGVYSELRVVANELFVGRFREKGDFSVREFVRGKGGRILFIEYNLGIGTVLTPIYKILFDLAIKEALCRSKTEGNVFFVIDEFKLLPNLYHIDNGVNFGRSLGAKFIVAMQNVRQVIDGYGEQKAYSILSAFATSIAFRTSDKATKEFVQSLYGKNRNRVVFRSASYSAGNKEQLTYSNVIEDWDLLQLKIGEAIVSISDYDPAPVRFKFKNYIKRSE